MFQFMVFDQMKLVKRVCHIMYQGLVESVAAFSSFSLWVATTAVTAVSIRLLLEGQLTHFKHPQPTVHIKAYSNIQF